MQLPRVLGGNVGQFEIQMRVRGESANFFGEEGAALARFWEARGFEVLDLRMINRDAKLVNQNLAFPLIDEIGLPGWLATRLAKHKLLNIDQLCEKSETDLFRLSGIANQSVKTIKRQLAQHNRRLAPG